MQEVNWEPLKAPVLFDVWPDDIPPLVQRWMQARELDSFEKFKEFTSFKLKDLSNPSILKDLDKAVGRLVEAFKAKETICLYGDFDMDGTPGVALLIRGLQFCGFQKLLSFQPDRFDHGYGVHPEIIEDFIDSHNVSLFVTVDVGITDVKAVDVSNSKNVDVIITDHHQQKEKVPDAYAIVNPNQKGCESGLTYLCGTGVAFYLILGLRRKMTELGLLQKSFDPKLLLDCFAIGTLTDMVPLVKENRVLVQHGMLQLARTQRLGLQLLMERLKLKGKRLTSSDVSISFAPKLNALSRMQSRVQPIDIFLVSQRAEAEKKVDLVMEAQEQRVAIQKKGEAIVEEKLSNVESPRFAFEWSEEFHKGVVGLLATKAMQKYQVPAIMGAVRGDKVVCSARAPQGTSLLPALEYCSDLLVKFGGHYQAAGLELELANVEKFKEKLGEYYELNSEVKERSFNYDAEASLFELNDDFKGWLKKLEPYGMGFATPVLKLEHLFVASTRVLKEKHLKMTLKDVDGKKIDALWFFAEDIDSLKKLTSQRVSVLAEPSINEYMGQESLQLFIKALKVEY